MSVLTYKEAVAKSMRDALKNNSNTIIYGLGVTDHIGIFGTTLGLAEDFGKERVFDTPLAEESMTGFGLGAALNNIYPIHIHIRTDFMLLAMNQLVNSIAKYEYMYGGLFKIPMLIRTIIGRSWGQGAQHSQSLQAIFAHIPGLTVVMPSSSSSVLSTYQYAIKYYKAPVISLEHRILYNCSFKVNSNNHLSKENLFTSFLVRKGKDVTIVATSVMVVDAINASDFVKENGNIDAEIIDLHCISHPNVDLILKSVKKTGRLIVADTGWAAYGVCADICRIISTNAPHILKLPAIQLSMAPSPCPTAKTLENFFYPNTEDIINAIYKLTKGNKYGLSKFSDKKLPKHHYDNFRGPF